MAFSTVLFDGTYFAFAGYAESFGTRMENTADPFVFVERVKMSNDDMSCVAVT